MSFSTDSGRRLSRDQITVAAALLAVAALAWLFLILRGDAMVAGSMDVMDSMSLHTWSATDYLLTWAMWGVMMAAMMLPSIIPVTHVYVAIGSKARRQGSRVPSTAVFVAGYLLVWTAFSLLATTAQLMLDRAALLTDNARTTSLSVAGVLLLASGLYELTPLKRSCLRVCRGPVDFIARHWRRGALGALQLGARAGMFCLGCCALLMTLLFVGGVMNLLWVAIISVFVLVEKVVPVGEVTSRVGAVALMVGGVGLLAVAAF